MTKKLTPLIIFLFFFSYSKSQTDLLSRKVDLNASNITVKQSLKNLSNKANVKFSYSSEIVQGNKIISYDLRNKRIDECINTICSNKVRYKVAGNHIILLKQTPKKEKEKKKKYIITGNIVDANTGVALKQVSVYDVEKRYSAISNEKGDYSLTFSADDKFRGVSYSKTGYFDTAVVIKAIEHTNYDMKLHPEISAIEQLEVKEFIDKKKPVEESFISELLIPNEVIVNSKNLDHINDKRAIQLSVLPGIGTSFSSYGVVDNNFSFNLLAGYNKGVKGIEVGGLLNIDKKNVHGIQIGGLVNYVGGNTNGIQIGGLANINVNKFKGLQISAINNTVKDSASGFQVSGLSNIASGKLFGIQASGFYNASFKGITGIQMAGFINTAFGEMEAIQLSGFANYAAKSKGVQASGFVNYAKNITGAQLTGFVNISGGTKGAQLAGFANISKENKGAQISGIVNIAKINKGAQIALVNLCDSSTGVSIGLFNFVRKGFNRLELTADENFAATLKLKTGTKRFYNIYKLSAVSYEDSLFTVGYGFGKKFDISKRISLSLDITSNYVGKLNFADDEENSNINIDEKTQYLLNKALLTFDFMIFKHLSIIIGPSFNLNLSDGTKEMKPIPNIISDPFYNKVIENVRIQAWVGCTVGLRF